MRSAITAISLMLCGASILTFISALFLPSLRVSSSQEGDSTTASHESSASVSKAIKNSALAETRGPAIANASGSSDTQAENSIEQRQAVGLSPPLQVAQAADLSAMPAANQNSTDSYHEDSSAILTLATQPETTPPRIDKQSPEPAGTKETHAPQRHLPMKLLVLGKGSFAAGGARPKPSARDAIDKIVPIIQARAQENVIVEGHSDMTIPDGFTPDQGSKWNKIISTLRAKAVAKVLMQKGVAGDRISFIGLGDAFPLASNLTFAGRAKNRRVEIRLSPPRRNK